MRTLLLFFAATAFAAPVPIVKNQFYRLPVGKNYFTVYQSTDTSSCTSSSNPQRVNLPSGWTRAKVQFQQDYNTTNTTVDSADPAEFCFPFTQASGAQYGGIRYVYGQLDGSNNLVGVLSDQTVIAIPQALQTGTITFPQTMVGFPGLEKSISYNIPSGTLTGTTAAYFQVNNYSYFGKGSWKVNNSPWRTFESCLDQTTLATGINSTTRTIVVADATWIPVPNYIYITDVDTGLSEQIHIASKVGNTLTADAVWRTQQGTGRGYGSVQDNLGVAHSSGAIITLANLQMLYGGVGGGFNTLKFTCALPAGTLTLGANTISMRFDNLLDDSSGFRVIKIDLLSAAGTVLQDTTIAQEDPSTWTAPAGSDVTRGLTAWTTAALKRPSVPGYSSAVFCKDCHAVDGRDLKYFAYSPTAIQARALLHDLTQQQADDISAYILSNASPVWGRPWNPPYQPGPGLSALSTAKWAGGAPDGINAVLDRDRDMFGYLMSPYDGTGTITDAHAVSAFDPTVAMNPHDIPLALQFPDWNHWLPRIHPIDAWGSAWTSSANPTNYAAIRSAITPGSCASYANSTNQALWDAFAAGMDTWLQITLPATGTQGNPRLQSKVYSNGLWELVKTWEIMQEYGLEGCYQTVYATPLSTQTRGWRILRVPFDMSPNIQHSVVSASLCGNPCNMRGAYSPNLKIPQYTLHNYISAIWYNVQLMIATNNKHVSGQSPQDWSYLQDFQCANMQYLSPGQAGNCFLFYAQLLRTMYGNSSNVTPTSAAAGPEIGPGGGYVAADIEVRLLQPSYNRYIFQDMTDGEVASLFYGLLTNINTQNASYTNTQWGDGATASPGNIEPRATNVHCAGNGNGGAQWPSRFMWWLTGIQYFGTVASHALMPTAISNAITWAAGVWTGTDFTKINTTGNGYLSGSYDVQVQNYCVP